MAQLGFELTVGIILSRPPFRRREWRRKRRGRAAAFDHFPQRARWRWGRRREPRRAGVGRHQPTVALLGRRAASPRPPPRVPGGTRLLARGIVTGLS